MIGAVHAVIGAALGSLIKKKKSAFAAGVVSHIIADALPHKDFQIPLELGLLAGTMTGIAAWRGVDSPEFWGALGAVIPDVEHGLVEAGTIDAEDRAFPTHIFDGKYHGVETDHRWSQVIIAGAAILTIALSERDKP